MIRKLWGDLWRVLVFIGLLWVAWMVSLVVDIRFLALQPRSVSGLVGVATMPLLHQDLNHILGNTIPLTALLLMLQTTQRRWGRILTGLWICSGTLVWLLGREGLHMGASTLIYAVAAWLITAAFHERRPLSIAAAVLVPVLFGPLFWGLFPTAGSHVSWDGHSLGAAAGAALAWAVLPRTRQTPPTIAPPPAKTTDS
ncbi:MAG TPA: rhomboid family intramembrane serine protease [Planctomycetaceae bacterium]|nr:rhomboid family intramembrane serine protease [Planctomycetaceae bacterium]